MSNHRVGLGLLLTCIMILGTIQPLGLILDEKSSEVHRADGEESGFSGQDFLLNKVSAGIALPPPLSGPK